MEPVWQLLNAKINDDDWNAKHKAGLRSAAAGRQFTQARVMLCGWADHDRCLVCLNNLVEKDSPYVGEKKRTIRDPVVATSDQLLRAPIGDIAHRLWTGGCLKTLRDKKASANDVMVAGTCMVRGHPAWERGLMVRPPLPKRKQSKVETFNWHVRPPQLPVHGNVYPDGSFLDGITVETGRGGWAFSVLNDEGVVVAAAYGVPPPWVQGIEGAEAWALFQSLLVTLPSLSKYWPDCLPVYLAVRKGPEVALDPKNVLARVHGMILTALEDAPANLVGWMPSHLAIKDLDLRMAMKCDWTLVGRVDLEGNKLADELAKRGVEYHRVTPSDVKVWRGQFERAKARAVWIGVATAEANDFASFPFKDSEASRWKADAAQRAKKNV